MEFAQYMFTKKQLRISPREYNYGETLSVQDLSVRKTSINKKVHNLVLQ